MNIQHQIDALQQQWTTDPRWAGIERPYSAADVVRLRGSLQPAYTLAARGADRLWTLVNGVWTFNDYDVKAAP